MCDAIWLVSTNNMHHDSNTRKIPNETLDVTPPPGADETPGRRRQFTEAQRARTRQQAPAIMGLWRVRPRQPPPSLKVGTGSQPNGRPGVVL